MVTVVPYLTGVTLKWMADDIWGATVQVAANPAPNISWTIKGLQGEEMEMETVQVSTGFWGG